MKTPLPDPEPIDQIAELRLAALPNAVGTARRLIRHQLSFWRMAQLTEDVVLIADELITNAIKATGSMTVPASYAELYDQKLATVILRLHCTDKNLFIAVWDAEPAPPIPVQATEVDEGGRGLLLVRTLSEEFGHYPSAAGGKVVWSRVRRPAISPPLTARANGSAAHAQAIHQVLEELATADRAASLRLGGAMLEDPWLPHARFSAPTLIEVEGRHEASSGPSRSLSPSRYESGCEPGRTRGSDMRCLKPAVWQTM